MPLLSALATGLDFAEKLGLIEAVKAKLLRKPDEAADKLVVVLEELSKVYEAIDSELSRYLSLSFDAHPHLVDERKVLLGLEAGQLMIRIAEARGHCHKLNNIYVKYLNPWFGRMLSPSEQSQLQTLFLLLGSANSQMLSLLDELVAWLSSQASATLDLVDAGKLDEANRHVRAARRELAPVRGKMAKSLVDLRNLQAEFIAASGID